MIENFFSVKYAALALLVLQNTFLVVFMRYSRTIEGPMYASSTAVTMMEIVKLASCLCVITYEKNGVLGVVKALQADIISQPLELLILSVPSFLYTVQNNLLY